MVNSPPSSLSRRSLPTRACDRCRRRKAKCDWSERFSVSSACTSCRGSGEPCTFNVPPARRGPKPKSSRHRKGNSENNSGMPGGLVENQHHTQASLQFSDTSTPALLGPRAIPLDPANSTLSLASPSSWSSALVEPTLSVSAQVSSLQRWEALARSFLLQDPSADLERIVNKCIDLFLEYLFPLIPLVHEPDLRDSLRLFTSLPRTQQDTQPAVLDVWQPVSGENHAADSVIQDQTGRLRYSDRAFSLITAVCAEAAFLLPKDIFPEGEAVAPLFLQASRSCLRSYLEIDLEYPDASSVAIRYFHSNCLHAAGKPRLSWHIFGEATRLVQAMKMHDETSLQGLSSVEAELRRRTFWIVYVGDKSAAILNGRPINIQKLSFESGITTEYPSGVSEGPVMPSQNTDQDVSARHEFIAGFNANLRLWQAAAELILEIRLLESQNEPGLDQRKMAAEERHQIGHLYVSFITSLDKLPQYLRVDALAHPIDNGGRPSQHQQRMIQWANLHLSLPCLRMVIDKKLEDLGYYAEMEHPDMSLLRKTEIARDMLRAIREAPFWSLQVNGEPCVEKIRLIGASLLEVVQQHEGSPFYHRARDDLSVLLDVLTRLDSKASDALRGPQWTEPDASRRFEILI